MWPPSVSHPFCSLNSSLGLAVWKQYGKIIRFLSWYSFYHYKVTPSLLVWAQTYNQPWAWCRMVYLEQNDMTPSHYLNQFWCIVGEALRYLHEGNFIGNAPDIYPWYTYREYRETAVQDTYRDTKKWIKVRFVTIYYTLLYFDNW